MIHQEINLLRGENQNQNIQIALLQEKVGLHQADDETELHGQEKESQPQLISGSIHQTSRQERPARLLPLRLLFDYQKNDTDYTKPVRKFYGPPTNCSDLQQLGYTLNGFYLVNKTEANSLGGGTSYQIETVFCAFKQEGSFNSSAVENPVGILKIHSSNEFELREKSDNIVSMEDVALNNNNSIGRLIFHIQINKNSSTNIIQEPEEPVKFDNIIINSEKSYDLDKLAFFTPVTGTYKFVFEGKILTMKGGNVTFRLSCRFPPDYRTREHLTYGVASDLTRNRVTLEATKKLSKSARIQLKSATIGSYTLSADNSTYFKVYLLSN